MTWTNLRVQSQAKSASSSPPPPSKGKQQAKIETLAQREETISPPSLSWAQICASIIPSVVRPMQKLGPTFGAPTCKINLISCARRRRARVAPVSIQCACTIQQKSAKISQGNKLFPSSSSSSCLLGQRAARTATKTLHFFQTNEPKNERTNGPENALNQ